MNIATLDRVVHNFDLIHYEWKIIKKPVLNHAKKFLMHGELVHWKRPYISAGTNCMESLRLLYTVVMPYGM